MAKNYSYAEFVTALFNGADTETRQDMGRRYPLLTAAVSEVKGTGAGDAFMLLAKATPEFITARKIEKGLEGSEAIATDEDDVSENEADEEEAHEEHVKETRTKNTKHKHEDDKDEKADGGKYDGMTAPELFKECKKRGIKAAPKKPAKFYVELLEKEDNAKADSVDSDFDDEDDEDWDI